MPSLAESRRQVRERLDEEVDHDALLASLQDEIDKHNAVKDDVRDSMRKHTYAGSNTSPERSTRFRFKSKSEDTDGRSKHRERAKKNNGDENHRRRKRKKTHYPTTPGEDPIAEGGSAHPFPREPADPLDSDGDAFRASLFDALADDEGAAAYWESVYSQPVHVYPRPSVPNTATGQLEEMNDDEYVEYVKRQMWERKHPEAVLERNRREREMKEEEEERVRRREDFVRRKEQAAWERSQRRRFRQRSGNEGDDRYEYEFNNKQDWTRDDSGGTQAERQEYASAWTAYLTAWDQLKLNLGKQTGADDDTPSLQPSKRIPWPVLKSKPPTKPNIEAFMQHVPGSAGEERLRLLKAERVRWHPDKVQQRFGGSVDDGTMKLVTGVFQIVDSIVEGVRKNTETS